MSKARIATCWLEGCSGCHMSVLDLDEFLIDLAGMVEMVYGPLVDAKTFPDGVDVTIVEGAVANEEQLEQIKEIRGKTELLVSLGDCAVTGNVPSMRNKFSVQKVLERAYVENSDKGEGIPADVIPKLLERAAPVHEAVPVDLVVPGCPPPADAIKYVLTELLEGRMPEVDALTRFGA